MRVDVEKKNPALESLFTDPEQTIFLDANFFIPPDRSRMGTKPIPFLKFCEIWLDPIFDAFPNLAIHESVYHELVADAIQKQTLKKTSEMIEQLVEERRRQGMTQQNLSDITGILPPNLARLESGNRVPTLAVLQKYASALGMHIELKLCDGIED